YGAALDTLYVGSYDELFISGSSNNDVIIKSTTSNKDMIFRGNDGGVDTTLLTLNASVPSVVINDDQLDLDFVVRSPDETKALYLNAANEVFHVNHGETSFATKIHSTDGEAITVNPSGEEGVIINEDGRADIDFRVESDTNTHMFFVDAGNEIVTVGKSTAPGSDINFFVSGSGYSRGYEDSNAIACFGGDVVISGSLSAKEKHLTTHKYTESSADQMYVRFNAAGANSTPGVNNKFIAPYSGQLVKVIARSTTAMDSTVISSHQGSNGDANIGTSAIESTTVDVASANTSYEFTFSDSYFSAGYILGISVNPTTGPGNLDLTAVWEFDSYK
ncbi:MAG: hypothetical protein CMB80_03690, partial [Flammeovirgaceae bacterium]|nr:hypothetical protein [Flammeovirgaceae bacterium]